MLKDVLSRYKIFGGLSVAYIYYAFWYKTALIKHDAELAREFCPSYVKDFIKCKEVDLSACKKQMLQLHNCIHTFKGFNQENKDLL